MRLDYLDKESHKEPLNEIDHVQSSGKVEM